MNIWVYDIETYPNYFLVYFYNINTKEILYFQISPYTNDEQPLQEFLKTKNLQLIGFNNINFDYPLLHCTILRKKGNTPESINNEANRIIKAQYSAIWDNQILIPQLDLFKIWHYDNKNKATSLKWLEFAMRSSDVRDLPYPPGTILTKEQMDEILAYCRHDVKETYAFYTKSMKHIEIRQFYSKLENLNLINASEIKMSKEIFTKQLSQHMNVDPNIIRKLRTYRDKVELKDIVFDYLKFNDPINNSSLQQYLNSTWIDTSEMTEAQKKKLAIKFTVPYKNVIREYAEGGLHSFGKPGIYKSDNDYILVDVDFASFYPHISFKNKLHPEHIPEPIFSEIYEGFYKDRNNYPKSDPRNYVLKIILNGSYGLSKDKYSMLYDPKWQLAICINGQLILTLLTEKIFEACTIEPVIIFENTDGAMYKIHKSDLNNLTKACKLVESIVNIPLEIQQCDKIIIKDVNNYINVINDNNIKFKGAFEIDRDYHKNHSKRIVPVALANYFINNVPVEKTILNYLNYKSLPIVKEWDYINDKPKYYKPYRIFDFCLGAKMKGGNKLYQREFQPEVKVSKADKQMIITNEGYKEIAKDFYCINDNDEIKGAMLDDIYKICISKSRDDTPLAGMNRYYVSNNGYELIKKLPPLKINKSAYALRYNKKYPNENIDFNKITIESIPRESNIEAGQLCTIFNKYQNKENYDINFDYYINECNKIVNIFNNDKDI
jgi:hypothetical protein